MPVSLELCPTGELQGGVPGAAGGCPNEATPVSPSPPLSQRMSAQEAMPVMNGVSGSDSDGYNHWSEMKPAQPKSLSPPQPQKQLSDSYSNTLPVRKNVPPKNSYASGEAPALLPGALEPAVLGSAHRRGQLGDGYWGAGGGGTVTHSIPSVSGAARAPWPGH